jgi:hypothetical protein
MIDIQRRVPVVAGLAYVEQLQQLPTSFTATLVAEPDNRYFRHALAVLGHGARVGYVAPEIAIHYFEPVKAHGAPVSCPARRASVSDHHTSGVELLLDFSALPVTPEP